MAVSIDNKLNLKFKGFKFTSGDLSHTMKIRLRVFDRWFADFMLPAILRSKYTKDSPEIQRLLQVGDWESVIGVLKFYYDDVERYMDILSNSADLLTYWSRGMDTKLSFNMDDKPIKYESLGIADWLEKIGIYHYFNGEGFSVFSDYDPEDEDYFDYITWIPEEYNESEAKRNEAIRDIVHLAMNNFLYTLYSFFKFGNESVKVKVLFEEVPLYTYFTYDNWDLKEQLSTYGFETIAHVKTPTKTLDYNLNTNPAHWWILKEANIYGLMSFLPIILENGEYTTMFTDYTMNKTWGHKDELGTVEEYYDLYCGFTNSTIDENDKVIKTRAPFVEGLELSDDAYKDLMRKSLDNSETVKNFVRQLDVRTGTEENIKLVPAIKDIKISEEGRKLELWVEYSEVDVKDMFEFAKHFTF